MFHRVELQIFGILEKKPKKRKKFNGKNSSTFAYKKFNYLLKQLLVYIKHKHRQNIFPLSSAALLNVLDILCSTQSVGEPQNTTKCIKMKKIDGNA